ncbi:hypothetical protein CKF48_13460 [Cytobacillus kochii]|uniref:SH3b domain-containing protein n=1 Tax=Cytobacillus kochii TaxID=859143 RepID=A0A248TJ60_9BACI|nr:hypothetical protein CKF48_13460 [Cytobacillus kochii]
MLFYVWCNLYMWGKQKLKSVRKLAMLVIIFLLTFNGVFNFHYIAKAQENTIGEDLVFGFIFGETVGVQVDLYEKPDVESEVSIQIDDDTKVRILEQEEEFTKIELLNESNLVSSVNNIGYVQNQYLVEEEEADIYRVNRLDGIDDSNKEASEIETPENPDLNSEDTQEEVIENNIDDELINDSEESILEEEAELETEDGILEEDSQTNINQSTNEENSKADNINIQSRLATFSSTTNKLVQGLALKEPTYVYESASQNAKSLKRYSQGSILYYEHYNSSWYRTGVYINGIKVESFIKKNDVETIKENTLLTGIAKSNKTNVYEKAADGSKVIKSYSSGSFLQFRAFTSGWYLATVYVNGVAKKGYIRASDIEVGSTDETVISGIGVASPTKVYQKTSTGSKVLKSYNQGNTLMFKKFVTGWYQTNVYVNGKSQKGYINANDIRIPTENKVSHTGVGLKAPTKVYSNASNNSSALKEYSLGSILQYSTFIDGWYSTNVYVNGKKRAGFIKQEDVENSTSNPKLVSLYAVYDKVHVYTSASKSAKVIKSYNSGHLLKVNTFTSNWYRATVYVNGKKYTGYIHKDDLSTEKPGYLNLDLRKPAKLTVQEIKALFDRKGHGDSKLKDYAQEFINVQNKYGVNATYLVAHTILETGWGKQSNLFDYKNNLYGYGAYDVCPFTCGYYFDSVEDSISNVAYQVKSDYLTPNGKWYNGPDLIGMNVKYATDKDWQNKIARLMEDLQPYDAKYYSSTNVVTSNGPAPSGNWSRDIPAGKPYPSDVVKNMPAGTKATINTNANWRSFPYVNNNSNVIGTLKVSTEVIVLGYNTDVKTNGSYPYDTTWYRISVNGKQGWIYGDYLTFTNAKQAKVYTSSYDLLQQFK